MNLDFDALLQTFLAQTEEGLAAVEERLVAIEAHPEDSEALGEIFRVVHTLKGDAGSLGFTALASFAHGLEDQLDELRKGQRPVTPAWITRQLQAVDALRGLLVDAAAGVDELRPAHGELLRGLDAASGAASADGVETGAPTDVVAGGTESESIATPQLPLTPQQVRTLRVDVAKLDQLLTLTGEIAVARGRLTQALEDRAMTTADVLEIHHETDRLHLDVQELVMALRMVPIGPTFRQHVRTVRDMARAHGKEARLEVSGGDVEVDNSVLQLLRDPLTHMIRNALDHGIESPERRAALGKPHSGLITLHAAHAAGQIVIELSDDGKGLDRQRILEHARARGLVHEDRQLNDAAIDQLIFEPGFSTAEHITDMSGRGVGMDVVRRNIEALRGSVAIDSRSGQGTTLTVRLPLTLAIIEGLLVGLASETYVVPLDAVVESVELPADAARHDDGSGVINLRGRMLPFVRLRTLFGVDGAPPPRENVVVVESEAGQAGIVVDALYGQAQTVIKPMAKLFRGVVGISASAVLGNGRVALILDVPALLHEAIEQGSRLVHREAEAGGS